MKAILDPVILILWQFATTGLCLSLKNVTIPQYGMTGGSVLLSCDFSLLPSDKLLFLKWYKNDEEFYRFTPSEFQPILTFPADGVTVELSRSNFNQLVLTNLTLRTSGVYKCEAMAEGTFQAPYGTGSMAIIATPENEPEIKGVRPLVTVGDRLFGTCTSFRSKPGAVLTFYVGGFLLEHGEITEYDPISEPNGLETSVLGFNFVTEKHHFRGGTMELRCTATILNLYWISTFNVTEVNLNAQPSYVGQTFVASAESSLCHLNLFTRLLLYFAMSRLAKL